MKKKIIKHQLPKLNFFVDYKKEFWFIENNYRDAQKLIGKKDFINIIKFNIPEVYSNDYNQMIKNISQYLKNHQNSILPKLLKQKAIYQKEWCLFEKNFFNQVEKTTGLKWKNKKYDLYFLYSCFWGGDYDEGGNTIYINPLLKQGDPIYVIFHELSHILFWEYIYDNYPTKFISQNHSQLWRLSEIMVNYPLLKISINYKFPLIIPPNFKGADSIIKKFAKMTFCDIIHQELKKTE